MSEPVVLTVTTSGQPCCSNRTESGLGLWGSLHALATISVAAATAHNLPPEVRTTRLLHLSVRANNDGKDRTVARPHSQPAETGADRFARFAQSASRGSST